MNKRYSYIQHSGAVVASKQFEYVMAISLHPLIYKEGVIRCVSKREGSVDTLGFVDKSVLHKIKSVDGLEKFEVEEELTIDGQEELIHELTSEGWTFIGLEDPDLIVDPETSLLHMYFSIAFINQERTYYKTYLGHAFGQDLTSLKMTSPVLSPTDQIPGIVKELSFAPKNSSGLRLNLVETSSEIDARQYSVVRIAASDNLDANWKFGDVVFNPLLNGFAWCAGHASPGPLFPDTFVDVGKNKRLGILNGREVDVVRNKEVKFGIFSIGLFIYNFEEGKIEWISKTPFIRDTQAQNITFASQFIQTDVNEGILYAHVDDSFVRAYTLYAKEIKKLLI